MSADQLLDELAPLHREPEFLLREFVFAHKSERSRLGPEAAMRSLIQPRLDAYFGGGFERLCRDALPMLYAEERVSGGARVGE